MLKRCDGAPQINKLAKKYRGRFIQKSEVSDFGKSYMVIVFKIGLTYS